MTFTRAVRLCLLLMLAVLLPLRGAVAASMACAGLPMAVMAPASPDATPSATPDANEDHPACHEDDTAGTASHTSADKCHLCIAAGSAAPLPSQGMQLAGPALCTSVVFPAVTVRLAGFVPDGPERPPRVA